MLIIDNVSKQYGEVNVLDGVSTKISEGTFAAIRGASGSGKSTLLMICAGLMNCDGGKVVINDTEIAALGPQECNTFRSATLGFVFQRFHLVPYLSVADNIRLVSLNQKDGREKDKDRVEELLGKFGLSHRAGHIPGKLSVGEQQRCALARALFNRPQLILADEPAGNLDPDNAALVLDTFREFTDDGGTVLMVTHDPQAAERADETWMLESSSQLCKMQTTA
ncbi:MAG: ABC transporter ATP-binding protein [Planctomycetes bacterium]|nr:ABC transporter ATP-binding protein [Planctomycetota bacterium]